MDKRKKNEISFCEVGKSNPKKAMPNKTAFYRHKGDFCWQGIKNEPYKKKGNEWSNMIRRVLIGSHGESAKFDLRYFEILSGGNSSLEKHKHEHVVICVKGRGIVITGQSKRKMEFMDVIYISPGTPHQLQNPFKKPFGFFCIVNSRRDKPKLL